MSAGFPARGRRKGKVKTRSTAKAAGLESVRTIPPSDTQVEKSPKPSEERAREQATRLKAVLDAAPAIIWIAHDPDCRVITGNKASDELLRVPEGGNVSKSGPSPESLAHYRVFKDGVELALEDMPIQRSAKTGQAIKNYAMDIVFSDGTTRHLFGNVTPVLNSAGQPAGAVAAFVDISERVKAEEALGRSEERYGSLFNGMTEGFAVHEMIFDENGKPVDYRFLDVNPAFERQTGLKRENIIGRLKSEVLPEEDTFWVDIYGKVTLTGEPVHFENYSAPLKRYYEVYSFRPARGQFAVLFLETTKRKDIELSLLQSESHYRLLFDTMLQGVVYHDPDGKIASMNPAAQEILGGTPDDFLGKTSEDLEHVTVREDGTPFPGLEHPAMAALRTGKEVRDVVMGVWNPREQRRRWIDISAVPLFRPGEKTPYQVYASFSDITRRKEIEEELLGARAELETRVRQRTADLAAASDLLEGVFASIDHAIAYMNQNYVIVRVNRAFAQVERQSPEYYVGKRFFALFPSKENESIFKRVMKTGEPFVAFEKPFGQATLSQGQPYWDWSAQPVKSSDGKVTGLVLSLVNVTGRKIAEQERLRLATAVEQGSDGVAITDADGAIVYANPAFEQLHGLAVWELLGRRYQEVLQFDLEEEPFRASVRDLLDRGDSWKGRLSRQMRDGSERKLDVTISPVRDEFGKIVNYAVSERDGTTEYALHETIRQMQKMEALGTLAGGIAHDFNNALVPILVNTELALLDVPQGSELANRLGLALKAANRGRDLVKQIISFSRQKEQKHEPVDVVMVVSEAARFLRSTIPKSIDIRQNIEPASALARADATQIHQILMNLGNNAVHAMRETGGVMTLGVCLVQIHEATAAQNLGLNPGPYITLTVSDTGRGIPPGVLAKVFDPFFTTKKPGEGLGMGLAVVHSIVKSHGGAVTVASEVGKGTTFTIFLPQIVGTSSGGEEKPAAATHGKGRILLIDDEEILVESMRPMLERLGYRVTALTDAPKAIELFRADPAAYDLIITDQTMPAMAGDMVARQMLAIRPDVPVIICTGFSEALREDKAHAMGVRNILMKPFTVKEAAAAIRAALAGKSHRESIE